MEYRDYAIRAARAGGDVIREHLRDAHQVRAKAEFDFVTEVDALSEERIRAFLRESFPEHRFFGEESVSETPENETALLEAFRPDEYTWIVDALDGTTNFIRGIPQFCVSIALARGKELIAGAVYDVSRDEMFSAEAGKGAFCNGRPIHVSQAETLGQSIVSFGFPAAERAKRASTLQALERLSEEVGSVRIFNCAALLLCYAACGRTDASFERGIHIWDMAAGIVLVREAGGTVTRCDGGPFDILSRENAVSNGRIHARLLEAIAPAMR